MTDPTEPAPSQPSRRSRTLVLLAATLGVIGAVAGGVVLATPRSDGATSAEHAAMVDRAAEVMPFDLDATTHSFTDAVDGGVEQVVAHDGADTLNVTAIRQHLAKEAAAFAVGDYRSPATIHGADMPGIAELQAGADRVQVSYAEVPAGAAISYRSTDPALVAAVRAWFARQRSDHSMSGMGMNH